MLSYRHAFHAGNHADILKHFILFLTLEYFNRKDKPYWYVDTHSGAGLYDLTGGEAQKVGEYRQGIGRLQQAEKLPQELSEFAGRLKTILPQDNLYCGSPWLAQAMTRSDDKLRLFELHPADFRHLQNNMREASLGRRGQITQADGYQGLISLLPPPTRRAVVLIDPPYEEKQDYRRVVHTLKDALKRFESGCYMVWYPCLSPKKAGNCPSNCKNSRQKTTCTPNFTFARRARTASVCTAAACSSSTRPTCWPDSCKPTCPCWPESWRRTPAHIMF